MREKGKPKKKNLKQISFKILNFLERGEKSHRLHKRIFKKYYSKFLTFLKWGEKGSET